MKMPRKGLLRKGIVLVIIGLFIGSCILPNVTCDVDKSSNIFSYNYVMNPKNLLNPSGDPPAVEWMITFGVKYVRDVGKSILQTADGEYIIAADSGSDVWLIKIDANGNEQWISTFDNDGDDQVFSVQHTSDGGYVLVGATNGYGLGGYDVWILKTDSDGVEQWSKVYGGSDSDWGYSIQQTTDEGFVVVGETQSYGAGDQDVWLLKTDPDGNEQWNRTFGMSENDWGYSIQQTTDEGYIVTGSVKLSGATNHDVWLIKTDVDGNEQWNKTFGGQYGEHGRSVQQTVDGGYIIGGVGIHESNGDDAWIIKTDSGGNKEWNKKIGGEWWDEGYSVQQTTDGGYVLAGFTGSYGEGCFDGWLIKVGANGKVQWDTTYGWELYEEIYAVKQTSDGGFILTGYTIMGDVFGGGDVWVIKVAREPGGEFKRAFMYGTIYNIEQTENYIHFNAYDVWSYQFLPYSSHHYTSGEPIIISKHHLGIVDQEQKFIFGFFKIAV